MLIPPFANNSLTENSRSFDSSRSSSFAIDSRSRSITSTSQVTISTVTSSSSTIPSSGGSLPQITATRASSTSSTSLTSPSQEGVATNTTPSPGTKTSSSSGKKTPSLLGTETSSSSSTEASSDTPLSSTMSSQSVTDGGKSPTSNSSTTLPSGLASSSSPTITPTSESGKGTVVTSPLPSSSQEEQTAKSSSSSIVSTSQSRTPTPLAVSTSTSTNTNQFTLTTPSTNTSGGSVEYTYVIASPTGSFSNSSVSSSSGFLKKPGQVIGTFIVVGAVAAAIIGCLICAFHRRQRRLTNMRTHWNFNHRQRRSESILDLPDVPPPRTIQIDVHRKPSVVWGPRPRSYQNMDIVGGVSPSPSLPSPVLTADTLHDIGFTVNGSGGEVVSPSSDYHVTPRSTTGLAVTSGQQMICHRPHSLTPSEPSNYPESMSMSTVEEESDSLYSRTSLFDNGSATPTGSGHHSPTPPTSLASGSNYKPSNPMFVHLKPMSPSPAVIAQPHRT